MPAMGLVGLLGMAVVLAACRGDDHVPVPPGGGEGFLIGNIFHNKTAITDRNHLEEELKGHVGEVDVSKMSEAEQEFYYFTMHDFDGNSFLDGLEMLSALADTLQESLGAVGPEERLAVYERMVDEVLQEDDSDRDGLLSYAEYSRAHGRTARTATVTEAPETREGQGA
ncbi:unnamed protein product [Lampetra fluviatilis]